MSTLKEWIKKREVILFLLLFLFCSLSFGLGYLYADSQKPAPILIQKMISK